MVGHVLHGARSARGRICIYSHSLFVSRRPREPVSGSKMSCSSSTRALISCASIPYHTLEHHRVTETSRRSVNGRPSGIRSHRAIAPRTTVNISQPTLTGRSHCALKCIPLPERRNIPFIRIYFGRNTPYVFTYFVYCWRRSCDVPCRWTSVLVLGLGFLPRPYLTYRCAYVMRMAAQTTACSLCVRT
jgi:hypothetical protein